MRGFLGVDPGKTTGWALLTDQGRYLIGGGAAPRNAYIDFFAAARKLGILRVDAAIEMAFINRRAKSARSTTSEAAGLWEGALWRDGWDAEPETIAAATWRVGVGIELFEDRPDLEPTKKGTVRRKQRKGAGIERDTRAIADTIFPSTAKLKTTDQHLADAICIAWYLYTQTRQDVTHADQQQPGGPD